MSNYYYVGFRSEVEMSTRSEEEIDKFRKMADEWWDLDGNLKGLHSMNNLRVAMVLEAIGKSETLEGLDILDVGCGGGILSEALANLGARVTGLDACVENIRVARAHADGRGGSAGSVRYEALTAEEFAATNPDGHFDAVVASEVVEHVDNPKLFVQTCCSMVKEGGSVLVTTENRTVASYIAAIFVAERVLGLLPVGTHDWKKFVTPQELEDMLAEGGCEAKYIRGMMYWPFFNYWHWWPFTSVNYAIHAVKVKERGSIRTCSQGMSKIPLGLVGIALASAIIWKFVSERYV